LSLIKMPNALLLAVQAGVLTFTPTLGAFVAGIVIILAGLAQSGSIMCRPVATEWSRRLSDIKT